MMQILIVDDEKLARERLKSLLAELPFSVELLEAANGLQALEMCDAHQVNTLLLDIRMPAMDGIEVARHLSLLEQPPSIIFTTAYDQHALAAFEQHAVDYLLKPVKLERLRQALERAERLNQSQLSGLEEQSHRPRQHLSARQQGSLQLIAVAEIRCFLADQKYVTAVHQTGELLLDESLRTLEKEFGEQFLRIHRNALIAPQYVEALEKTRDGQTQIRLRDVSQGLTVSRRHLASVRDWMKNKN